MISEKALRAAGMALVGAKWDMGHRLVSGEKLSAIEMAEYEAKAVLKAALPVLLEGKALVDVNPPMALLMSMAVRYDHGLGVPGHYDQPIFGAENGGHARRLEETISTMRKLHEEVVGTGFYSPENAARYLALSEEKSHD